MQAKIYNIDPFDVNKLSEKPVTIKFSWFGNPAIGNKCVIRNRDTNVIVYELYVDNMKLEHQLDTSGFKNGGIVNGEQYAAFITVYYNGADESELIPSDGKVFMCFDTPVFQFSNLNNIIESSSYEFTLEYEHDTELLDSWKITIYDLMYSELSTSNVRYTEDLSHTFSGFVNDEDYYVRGVGETVNGMKLDTGYISFSAEFDMAAVFSMLELTNIPERGCILVHSNIISADGEPELTPVTYINGQYVNLRDNSVTYDEGFLLDGDFSLVLYVYGIQPNLPFFEFGSIDNPNFKGTVTYRIGYFDENEMKGQLELKVTTGVSSYTIYAPPFDWLTEDMMLGFCLVRQNGLYDIQIIERGTVVETSSEEVS